MSQFLLAAEASAAACQSSGTALISLDSNILPHAKGKGVGEHSCQFKENHIWLHLRLSTALSDWRRFEMVHFATCNEETRKETPCTNGISSGMPDELDLDQFTWQQSRDVLSRQTAAQLLLVVGLLFAKTVYQELEVDTEMQHGLLPGCLALAAKFVPTMKQVRRSCAAYIPPYLRSFFYWCLS